MESIPALRAIINSPFETTSAPNPLRLISLSISRLQFDFVEKQIIGENDSSSIGTNIVLEDGHSFLLQETYGVGDGVIETTAQNEIFDDLDDTILDFTEKNPFGDAGGT